MVVSENISLRRMESLDPSQESIETVSLWCIHHKDSHQIICTAWMKAFNNANDKLRLALFYLANDVIQKAKHNNCESLKMGLLENIKDAIKVVRNDVSLMTKVNRLISIWRERNTFNTPTIHTLRAVARGEKIEEAPPERPAEESTSATDAPTSPPAEDQASPDYDDKALLDFDPGTLVSSLERNMRAEAMIERARVLLTTADLDLQAKVKANLKDRETGRQVLQDVDNTCARMTEFVCALEAAVQQHHKMLNTLEHGRAFFGQQLRDATVVEEAYRKFGQGIASVKEQVEEMERTGVYPAASPPRDAPSPSDNDDPFGQGVEMAIKEMKKPGSRDLIEVSEMEMDDEAPTGVIHTNESFMSNPAAIEALKMQAPVDPRLARQRGITPATSTSGVNINIPPPSVAPLPLINTSQPPPLPASTTCAPPTMYSPGMPPHPMISPSAPPPTSSPFAPPPQSPDMMRCPPPGFPPVSSMAPPPNMYGTPPPHQAGRHRPPHRPHHR